MSPQPSRNGSASRCRATARAACCGTSSISRPTLQGGSIQRAPQGRKRARHEDPELRAGRSAPIQPHVQRAAEPPRLRRRCAASRATAVAPVGAMASRRSRSSASRGSGTLEQRQRWRSLAGRVPSRGGRAPGRRSRGRRARWSRRPAPEPELAHEARRTQGGEASRTELHRRVRPPTLPGSALQPHRLTVGGVAGPAALASRAPVGLGRLRVGCSTHHALARGRGLTRGGRQTRLAIHPDRTSLTPEWRAPARALERASRTNRHRPVWRAARALGKGHSAGSRLQGGDQRGAAEWPERCDAHPDGTVHAGRRTIRFGDLRMVRHRRGQAV